MGTHLCPIYLFKTFSISNPEIDRRIQGVAKKKRLNTLASFIPVLKIKIHNIGDIPGDP